MEFVKLSLLKINSFNKRQWLLFSLFTTTSGIWFSLILNFWGEKLFLTTETSNGKTTLTILGAILTMVTVAWSLLSFSAQRYCDNLNVNLRVDEDELNQTETMYETIGNSVSSILEEIVANKILYIDDLENHPEKKPKSIYTQPCNELKRITDEIRKNMSKLLTYRGHNIKEKDLSVNLFYIFTYRSSQWSRIDSSRNETGLSIQQLFGEGTTISECLKSQSKFVYHHSKEEARVASNYMPVPLDEYENDRLKGSILCYAFSANKDDLKYIECVLSISTYKKRFSNKDDGDTIAYNIKNNVLSEYIPLINNALCDLYIHNMKNDT